MKNILFVLLFVLLSTACNPTLRITDRSNDEYRDISISKKIIIKGNYAYTVSKSGTPMMIDLDKYSIETLKKDTKNQKFFLHIRQDSLQLDD